MYGLIGKMKTIPGERDALIAILLEGVSGMPGCLSYVVAQDPSDVDAIWITEVWESAVSHKASLSLPSVVQAITLGKPLIASFEQHVETAPVGGHGLALGKITTKQKNKSKYPTSKAELLATIKADYDSLLDQVKRFSLAEQQTPSVNGEWAIKDVLTHLTAWEQMFLGWYRTGLAGETPITPAPGYTFGWKSLGALNQRIFEEGRHLSPSEATNAFAASHAEVVGLIETLSEEELFTPARYGWLGKATLEASIRANTYNHYRWASKLIQQWEVSKSA